MAPGSRLTVPSPIKAVAFVAAQLDQTTLVVTFVHAHAVHHVHLARLPITNVIAMIETEQHRCALAVHVTNPGTALATFIPKLSTQSIAALTSLQVNTMFPPSPMELVITLWLGFFIVAEFEIKPDTAERRDAAVIRIRNWLHVFRHESSPVRLSLQGFAHSQ